MIENTICRRKLRPLWKFFAARIFLSKARGSGSSVSTCLLIEHNTSSSQQKFSINCEGSSTASHSTPLMPETAISSMRVSIWCSPCPNSWKRVSTSLCDKHAGLPLTGQGNCRPDKRPASEARHPRCTSGRVHRPSTRRCACLRARINPNKTERQLAVLVFHPEKAHVGMPDGRIIGANGDREKRLSNVEHPGEHHIDRKVLPDFVLRKCVTALAQFFSRKSDIPRREFRRIEFLRGESAQLLPFPLCVGARALR